MSLPKYDEQLTSCDREPITTPGAIQAHGVLVAIQEPDMRIVEISANAQKVFGHRPAPMLGKDIRDYLDKKQYNGLQNFIDRSMWSSLQPITLTIKNRSKTRAGGRSKWDAFCHRQGDLLFLEFEPSMPATKSLPYYRELKSTFGRIYASEDVQGLCKRAAQAVRDITGFDRVMVYRFDSDWNGEVIAESVGDGLDPYLNHHFPASDIPRQARAAFLSNYVRMIPDVDYEPVPVLSAKSRGPLDMSKSFLRSVSPIHLQYLKNMGTQATLTISLIRGGKLWGLIACHHGAKKNLFHEVRLACELIGKSISVLLPSREHMEEAEFAESLRDARTQLWEVLEKYGNIREALWNHPDKLLSIVDAEGAAVRIDAEKPWMLVGKTPSRKQVALLARWLSTHMDDSRPTFCTNRLSDHYRQGKPLRASACGLLAVTIPKADSNFIMWFRPELIQQKTWAGDPRKQVTHLSDGTVKIEPRHSFEDWKEAVTLRSKPWRDVEVESALTTRSDMVSIDLRLQFKLAQEAIRTRDEFLSMASHELKTPLTSMSLQSQMARRRLNPGIDAPTLLERMSRTLQRMDDGIGRLIRLVDDMLDVSRISSGNLTIVREKVEITALVSDVVDRMRTQFEGAQIPLRLVCEAEAVGNWDRLRIEQCLANFLSNSLRYGQASPVTVTAGLIAGEAQLTVRDQGPGIAPEMHKRIFDKFERGGQSVLGLGLGLHICKQIVELHGGSVWVESTPGEGAAFCLSLPLYEKTAPSRSQPDSPSHSA